MEMDDDDDNDDDDDDFLEPFQHTKWNTHTSNM
jgi:hypothetical protein